MRKLFVCMMLVLALLAFGGAAMAQDPVCGSLSAADCDIITQSAAAQSSLTSSTFNFTLDINVGPQAIPLTGNGSFAIDPSAVSSIDPAALQNMTDPTAMVAALGTLIGAADFELNVNAMGMIDVNLLLVDGVGYFNFASIAPLLGGPAALTQMGLPTDWAGLDLVGAVNMLAPMMSGLDMSQFQTTEVDPAAQEAIMNAVMQHISITRVADDGGSAVFETTIDFAGMFQDQAFLDFVMSSAATSGTELTEEMMAQVGPMLQAIGTGFSLSATQKIDLATFHSSGFGFDFDIDGASLTAAVGEEVPDVSISAEFNFADFNAAPALSAPAGARVFTADELMGLMMGGMGGM